MRHQDQMGIGCLQEMVQQGPKKTEWPFWGWHQKLFGQPQKGAFLKILSSHILFYCNFLWCDDGIYDYDEEGDGVKFIVNMG